MDHPNQRISVIAQEALLYLDKRTEFWRQQKPRKKETKPKVVIEAIPTSYPPTSQTKDEKKSVKPPSAAPKKFDSNSPPKMISKTIPKPASHIKPSTHSESSMYTTFISSFMRFK